MTTSSVETTLVAKVRSQVQEALRAHGIQLQKDVDGPGHGKQWCVKGDAEDGLFASVSDRDDVIELGLLERSGGAPVNRLHVTVVLDEECITLNSVSESQVELNFDGEISSNADLLGLDGALKAFFNGASGPTTD